MTMKEHQARLEDAISSLDRYGFVPGDILTLLETISEFIDDEAHGRAHLYDEHFAKMTSSLESLKKSFAPPAG